MTLGPERLERPGADGVSPHDRVQSWLQETADATADAGGTARRVVPRLRSHGLADQVVVVVREADGPGLGPQLAARLVALRRCL